MRQAKLVVMYSLEYYKFKFRKCLLVADKRLRSGLKTHKHIAPSCLLRLLCFLKFSLLLARVPFIVLYILTLPSPFCQFSPPLIFSTLLRAPPRSPFAPFALSAAFVQPSLLSPPSHPSPHPFDSLSKENHSRSKEISGRFVRKHPLKNCHLRFTNCMQTPPQSPSKAEKRRFSQIF